MAGKKSLYAIGIEFNRKICTNSDFWNCGPPLGFANYGRGHDGVAAGEKTARKIKSTSWRHFSSRLMQGRSAPILQREEKEEMIR